jgi:hypothetical protein
MFEPVLPWYIKSYGHKRAKSRTHAVAIEMETSAA